MDGIKIKCAPVLIPTLNRYEHFVRCIESLKKNSWAKYTDVYIGLDYPSKETHWEGYNKILEYLKRDFSEFNKFYVFKRSKNYGAFKNMKALRNYIFNSYETFIRTDDDAEFSPNFLEYMNKCLSHYEHHEKVLGVTGYSYPVNWEVDEDSNVFEVNYIFPMWGTGFWKDKYLNLEKEITSGYIKSKFKQNGSNKDMFLFTDARYIDYVNGSLSWNDLNLVDIVTDISLGIYISLTNNVVITPVISKVRNHGFDGTGIYSQKIDKNNSSNLTASNYNYSSQIIDERDGFTIQPSLNNNMGKNRYLLNKFDKRSQSAVMKAKLKRVIFKLIGENYYREIWFRKNRTE